MVNAHRVLKALAMYYLLEDEFKWTETYFAIFPNSYVKACGLRKKSEVKKEMVGNINISMQPSFSIETN